MKRIDLGQALGILANLGVLVGILLLVFELSQNRVMMRALSRNDLSQGLTDVLSPMAADDELADLLLRGNRGEELTPSEAYRFEIFSELVFRYWENVHYHIRQDWRALLSRRPDYVYDPSRAPVLKGDAFYDRND